jgi:hypothetical protein
MQYLIYNLIFSEDKNGAQIIDSSKELNRIDLQKKTNTVTKQV